MMAVLLSGEGEEGEVWSSLSPEDAEAVRAIMGKGRKRKRTKKTKSKRIHLNTAKS